MVKLTVLHQFIEPARVCHISPVVLLLDFGVCHVFQKHLLEKLVVKIASRRLYGILPETSILVLFDHILDLIICQILV